MSQVSAPQGAYVVVVVVVDGSVEVQTFTDETAAHKRCQEVRAANPAALVNWYGSIVGADNQRLAFPGK